jgi:hypothetical protein
MRLSDQGSASRRFGNLSDCRDKTPPDPIDIRFEPRDEMSDMSIPDRGVFNLNRDLLLRQSSLSRPARWGV